MTIDERVRAEAREREIQAHVAERQEAYRLDLLRTGLCPTPAAERIALEDATDRIRGEVVEAMEAGSLTPLPVLSPEQIVGRQKELEEQVARARLDGRVAANRRADEEANTPTGLAAAQLGSWAKAGIRDEDLVVAAAMWAAEGANVRSALEAAGGDVLLSRARRAADSLREARAGERGFEIPGRDGLWVIDRVAS